VRCASKLIGELIDELVTERAEGVCREIDMGTSWRIETGSHSASFNGGDPQSVWPPQADV
jgi:hypothetical protein